MAADRRSNAQDIDPLLGLLVRQSQGEPGDGERGDADGDVDVEGPLPGQVVDEEAAKQRAGDGREAEDRSQRAHVLAAVLGRNNVGDDGLREDHQAAAAQPLDGAEDDKTPEIGGQGAAHRCERKQGDGNEEQVPPAQDVTELAIDGHHDGGGQQVGGSDPGLVFHAAELAHDGGHGGGDDGLVKAGQEHPGNERREDDPDALLGQQQRTGRGFGTDSGAHGRPSMGSGISKCWEKSWLAAVMFSISSSA